MKKSGFTISELLVALGIIAVTAALVGPMFTNIIPDKNKMKVISYYNKINEINQKLLSDPSLYPTIYSICEEGSPEGVCGNNELYYIARSGLKNENSPIGMENIPMNVFKGVNKYLNLFSNALISKNYDSNGIQLEDGSLWVIMRRGSGNYKFIINLNNGTGCSYGMSNCKKPDMFIFKVDENGAVTAGDAMTDAYLTNMTTVNNQKADRELAKKYLEERVY